MAQTSQYVASKDALLSLIQSAITANASTLTAVGLVGVEAFYAWPGGDGKSDMIFLGRHPSALENPLAAAGEMSSEIPVISGPNRQQRQQEFDIDLTCWSWRADLKPEDARLAEIGGQALLDIVDGVVASNSDLGLSTIQLAELRGAGVALYPAEMGGWLSVFSPSVHIKTRLT